MALGKHKIRFVLLPILLSGAISLGSIRAVATDFFVTDETFWFDPSDRTPVNVVIELTGLSNQRLLAIAQTSLRTDLFAKAKIANLENPRAAIQILFKKVLHSDILELGRFIEKLKVLGAKSSSSEIPFAVRVVDLENHDDFIAAVSGLSLQTIDEINAAKSVSLKTRAPLVFRDVVNDPQRIDPELSKNLKLYFGDEVRGHIPVDSYGRMPVFISGTSVAFHVRTFHAGSVLGRYNPGLVNSTIAQLLTANKYVESVFWNQFAPGAIPETRLLSKMNLPLRDVSSLKKSLDANFKTGWVMKGVLESSTNFRIITDKTDLVKEVRTYLKGDFDRYKKKIDLKFSGMDEDNVFEELQKHPGFLGWRISQFLNNPESVLVQKRVAIDREYRVEVIAGHVLGNGSTIDRHNWLLAELGQPLQISSAEIIQQVERYTQSVVDRLPPRLRVMNFAFDTALLKDGSFAVIETNAGSESGFLSEDPFSMSSLNKFLEKYPAYLRSGLISDRGLDSEEQMRFMLKLFKRAKIDPRIHYPGMQFFSDHIAPAFPPVTVDERFTIRSNSYLCEDLFRNQF